MKFVKTGQVYSTTVVLKLMAIRANHDEVLAGTAVFKKIFCNCKTLEEQLTH